MYDVKLLDISGEERKKERKGGKKEGTLAS